MSPAGNAPAPSSSQRIGSGIPGPPWPGDINGRRSSKRHNSAGTRWPRNATSGLRAFWKNLPANALREAAKPYRRQGDRMREGTALPLWVKMSRATHFVGTADLPQSGPAGPAVGASESGQEETSQHRQELSNPPRSEEDVNFYACVRYITPFTRADGIC